jgi:hypothetical protein
VMRYPSATNRELCTDAGGGFGRSTGGEEKRGVSNRSAGS